MSELPPDLLDLEHRLANRAGATPTALRARILAALGREASRPTPDSGWRWLLATAALVLVALNFTMSVVANMDWRAARPLPAGDVEAAARQIQGLAPEMSRQDAYRQAIVLRAGARMAPGPAPSWQQVLKQKERTIWDMH
jgi:hypothetical protein